MNLRTIAAPRTTRSSRPRPSSSSSNPLLYRAAITQFENGDEGRGRVPSGFTLIEVVISSALMGLILVSGYLCLSSGFSSQRLIESRSEAVQSARVAMALMSADLRCACPLIKDLPFLGMHRMLGDIEADNLDFGTHNYMPRRARESDFCEVSYYIDVERESGKLSLWRRRDATPDDEPLSGGSREEIARGVRGLKFEYYDGWDWYDDWGDPQRRRKAEMSLKEHPNLFGMPEAVRITLRIEPPSRSKSSDSSEPPLVFQTVARLNLAAISQKTPTVSGDKEEKSEQNQPTPDEGGTPQ